MSQEKENSPGRGALFRSREKTLDWHSDFFGYLTQLECPHCGKNSPEVHVSGYLNTSKDGGKQYIGLKLKVKTENIAPSKAPDPGAADDGWGI